MRLFNTLRLKKTPDYRRLVDELPFFLPLGMHGLRENEGLLRRLGQHTDPPPPLPPLPPRARLPYE